MSGTTKADVLAAFELYTRAHRAAMLTHETTNRAGRVTTLTADNLGIDFGSITYGRAFRLFYVHPETGAHYNAGSSNDYLGMTRTEAAAALRNRASAIFDVLEAQARRRHGKR